MNKCIFMGRPTADPEVRYSKGANPIPIANFTLAVERKYKKEGSPTADFIDCVAYGHSAEFAENYIRKGMKIAVTGRLEQQEYTNKEGRKVKTFKLIIEDHEFVESKKATTQATASAPEKVSEPEDDGFMDIPDGIDDELPFGE